MLDLDRSRWATLARAYGVTTDMPDLLRRLAVPPAIDSAIDPWQAIWSELTDQDDEYNEYSASLAAAAHVIRRLKQDPEKADDNYFQFPAWVAVCRQKDVVGIPADLQTAYCQSLSALPAVTDREWDERLLHSALSALAAAKGFESEAEVETETVQDLTPAIADRFWEWCADR